MDGQDNTPRPENSEDHTWLITRAIPAPYANKNYIMKGVDSCGSESGNELAGAMRLRPEGNETHKGLSPLRHGGGQ